MRNAPFWALTNSVQEYLVLKLCCGGSEPGCCEHLLPLVAGFQRMVLTPQLLLATGLNWRIEEGKDLHFHFIFFYFFFFSTDDGKLTQQGDESVSLVGTTTQTSLSYISSVTETQIS